MKIFISHSSRNAKYGQAIVDLLSGVGVNSNQIIFTSNDAFGIPTGQNIFKWLKDRIVEKPHVIYLLSPEYYSSVACLNEMGAAWIVENQHTIIFTPQFKPSSPEFQNGALDPREMGFKINNTDRILEFVESLKEHYDISNNAVFVSQKIRRFIEEVNSIESIVAKETKPSLNTSETNLTTPHQKSEHFIEAKPLKKIEESTSDSPQLKKFLTDLQIGKLKDEEILLMYYAIDTARVKLGVGWKSAIEIDNIKIWEDINNLNSKLSTNYDDVMRRYDLKKLTEVSEFTSSNNPREIIFIEQFKELILDSPDFVTRSIEESAKKNQKSISPVHWNSREEEEEEEDLPF